MGKRERYTAEGGVPVGELSRYREWWVADGESRQLSPSTLAQRRGISDRLLAWLATEGCERCGREELRRFAGHLAGRTGEGGSALKPGTLRTYHTYLRSLFLFLVDVGLLDEDPMTGLSLPRVRPARIEPFDGEQAEALLRAAREGTHPARDEAILLFLFDTGARAAEACGITIGELDMVRRRVLVRGKGGKERHVYFSATTAKALWRYLAERHEPDAGEPLWVGDRGHRAGEALQPRGLWKLVNRLGERAGVSGVRCSPHTWRHSFAVEFLRGGGDALHLQRLMGHESLSMTMRYVSLAATDLQRQHQQASPVERLKKGKGKR